MLSQIQVMSLNALSVTLADYVQLSLQAGFIQRPAIRHPYHHVFGERTMATLGRLMSLLSPFDVVIWMTDGWPLYESRLKGKLPRYQQALYSAH